MKVKDIHLKEIDLDDERFRTSYFFNLERLADSIKKFGLFSPVRVRPGKKGWVVVAGWKRVLASLDLGMNSIPAVEAGPAGDLDCFLGALEENLATREVGLLEKAMALRRLEEFGLKRERLIREFLPRLGLPSTGAHFDLFINLAHAEDKLKEFVAKKNPPPGIIESLLWLKPAERILILPILYPLGQNKQKELLEDLLAVSLRDGKPVQEVMRELMEKEIAAEKSLSGLQKAELVRTKLRQKRYPHFFQAKKDFTEARKSLPLSAAIVIQPDAFFEEPGLTVSFRCQTTEEFKRYLAELQRLADHQALAVLFRVGRES